MPYRLLAIFAHPDDEGAVSGSLVRYARSGSHVTLCCVTRGEVGESSDPALATRETMGQVRQSELECAVKVLGIQQLRFLDYRDSGMAGTAENDDPRAFVQSPAAQAVGRIVALIRELRPHIVITFEPGGWYGHPDHIAASHHTTAAYAAAGDTTAYSAAGTGWQPQRLFYAAILKDGWRALVEWQVSQGMDVSSFGAFRLDEPDPMAALITHGLDCSAEALLKRQGLACHRTQFGGGHPMMRVPDSVFRAAFGHEHFVQVQPPLTPTLGAPFLDDLCYGVNDDDHPR